MRTTTGALMLLLGACTDAPELAFEAGPTDAATDVDHATCTVSIAAYCDAHACPLDEDAALAELCVNNAVVSVCGGVVLNILIDFGSGYIFDDSGLTTVISFNNGTTTCIAGTPGSNVSNVGCSFTTNACLVADAGDASEQ